MRRFKHIRRAMTLVEVIVAMAVIGIISISMITLFTSAFVHIARAGNTSEALFQAHKQIETVLVHKSAELTPTNIELTFSSDGTTIISEGNVIKVNYLINKSEVEITFFHPKY